MPFWASISEGGQLKGGQRLANAEASRFVGSSQTCFLSLETSAPSALYRGPPMPICRCMATYTVTPKADRTGFTVSILDGEGALQTTLGFTREAEADAWVTQATRMNKSWAPGRSRCRNGLRVEWASLPQKRWDASRLGDSCRKSGWLQRDLCSQLEPPQAGWRSGAEQMAPRLSSDITGILTFRMLGFRSWRSRREACPLRCLDL